MVPCQLAYGIVVEVILIDRYSEEQVEGGKRLQLYRFSLARILCYHDSTAYSPYELYVQVEVYTTWIIRKVLENPRKQHVYRTGICAAMTVRNTHRIV